MEQEVALRLRQKKRKSTKFVFIPAEASMTY